MLPPILVPGSPLRRQEGLSAVIHRIAQYVQAILRRLVAACMRTPSRSTLIYVAILTLPQLLVHVALKLHKIKILHQALWTLPAVKAIASDLAFAGLWLGAWAWLLTTLPERFRRYFAVILHITTALLLTVAVAEHGFWLASGSLLDGDMVIFFVKYFSMIAKVAASEYRAWHTLAFAGALAVAIGPLWLRGGRRWWLEAGESRAGDGRRLVAAVLLLAGLPVVLRPVPMPSQLQPITAVSSATIAAGVVRGTLGLQSRAVDLGEVKPLQPMVVTKPSSAKDYNVVLVVLESTRALSTTPYQPGLATTPFLDKLASRGIRVDTAYTTIPHTTKALVAVHCGLYPKITPYFDEAAPGAIPTDCLARILKRHGWATGYFMASESVFERNRELVQEFGFDTLVAKEELDKTGDAKGFEEVNYFGYEDLALIRPAMRWVDAHKGNPTFQAFLTLTSHHPYIVPKNWKTQTFSTDSKVNDYLNALHYQDEFLRQLYEAYEKRGLNDRTVWVLIGDHGEGFGEHGKFQHDSALYEEMLRVPMVVVGPGIAPQVVRGLHQNIDVLPTILDALGLEVAAGTVQGKSVLSTKGHDRLFFSCWHRDLGLGLRQGNQKIIWNYDKKPIESYDLSKDASETHDLLTKLSEAQRSEALTAMKAWKSQVNGQWEQQGQRRVAPFVGGQAPHPSHPCDVQFGDFAKLIGYDIESGPVQAGGAIWLTTYWQSTQKTKGDWQFFVHILGPGNHFTRADHIPVEGSHPVSAWEPGQYVVDKTWLRFDPGVPTGIFDVFLGMYNTADHDHRAGLTGTGAVLDLDNRVWLAGVNVHNAKRPPEHFPSVREQLPADRKVQVHDAPPDGAEPLDIRFGDSIRVFRIDAEGLQATPGSLVRLHYHLQVLRKPPRFSEIFLHINGPKVADSDKAAPRYVNDSHAPLGGAYPVEAWQAGDIIDELHEWRVPKDWPAGDTGIHIGFWNPNLTTPDQRLPVTGTGATIDKGTRLRTAVVHVQR